MRTVRFSLQAVILSEPRTGSTWLISLLWENGFGVPEGIGTWELFDSHYNAFPPVEGYDAAVAYVHESVGAFAHEGRAAIKVMYNQVIDFLAHCGVQPRCLPEFLRDAFPQGRFIRLRRRDHVAQAVSLFAARRTGVFWNTTGGSEPDVPPYDRTAIAEYLAVPRDADAVFAQSERRLDALGVAYEDLLADPAREAGRIAAHLGYPISLDMTTPIRRQTTTDKLRYAARFCSETR